MEELARGAAPGESLNSRLISALDFLDTGQLDILKRVAVDRAKQDLELDFEARLDTARRNRLRRRFALLLGIFVALGLTPWFAFTRVAGNLRASLFAVRETLWPVVFEVSPPCGTHVHKLGDEVPVSIRFEKRGYDRVVLVDRRDEDVERLPLRVNEQREAARVLRGDAECEHRLHFEFGRRRSDEIVVVFTDFPVLENMQTELVYPVYTRMLPRTLEGVQSRLFALPGTKMRIGFTFSKELAWARFTWSEPDGEKELNLEVDGRYAYVGLVHSEPRTVTLQVEDVHGLSLQHPVVIGFEVQQDEKPQVIVPGNLTQDMAMLEEAVRLFGFGVRIKDDFGVTRCVLKWRKATVDNPTQVLRKGEVERTISPPRRNALVAFEKVFEHLAVQPGDKITFWVEAFDNRHPEPQMSESARKSLFVYQQELDDLYVLGVRFGGGGMRGGGRIPKSRRERSVTAPMATRTIEQFVNTFEADIATPTRAPRIRGPHVQAVRDYLRLMSTAVQGDQEEQSPGGPLTPTPEGGQP